MNLLDRDVVARADRLEEMRKAERNGFGDGEIDDLMLAHEIEGLFVDALKLDSMAGDVAEVLQLRIRFAAFKALDLVVEDLNRRELLA